MFENSLIESQKQKGASKRWYTLPLSILIHVVVIGSGVTGVEFTHLFESLGSRVTLLVSRQQVLPIKDAEVAAVLEEAFLARVDAAIDVATEEADRLCGVAQAPREKAKAA